MARTKVKGEVKMSRYTKDQLAVRMFNTKPREDVDLTLALPDGNMRTAVVHLSGCADLAKAKAGLHEGFNVQEALNYADDQYIVSPCAKERNWTKAEKASRPDW